MKFVFASDSFKGSLSALEITKLLKQSAVEQFGNDIETVLVPVADGGEGTVDALILATGGEYRQAVVTGPMGTPVTAQWGVLGDQKTAVIEMAEASGLPLMKVKDPLNASSEGTGELIKAALDAGFRKLIIGIGGSATNDGGMGLLTGLGVRFLGEGGEPVPQGGASLSRVRAVDFSLLEPALSESEISVICDVNNPLLGENGATVIYGPQKGVTAELMPYLEMGMAHYANVLEVALGRDISHFAGAGAAGGVGAALAGVLNCTLKSGITAVLEAVDFDRLIRGADLVITGEGRIDGQSILFGKVVAGVARHARAFDIPVVAISGGMAEGADILYRVADSSIMTTICAPGSVEDAMKNARALYKNAADRVFRMLKIGMRLTEGAERKLIFEHLSPDNKEAFFDLIISCQGSQIEASAQELYENALAGEIRARVCRLGDTPVGYVLYMRDREGRYMSQLPGLGAILAIGVKQEFKGRGLSKRLLLYAEDELRLAKVDGFYATLQGPAESFFERCGYRRSTRLGVGDMPFFIKPIQPAI